MLETIKNLTSTEYIISRLTKVCDSVDFEKNGTVIAYIRSSDHTSPLMLATHIDLPHFICMGKDNDRFSLHYVGNIGKCELDECPAVSESGVKCTVSTDDSKVAATSDEPLAIGELVYVDTPVAEEDGRICRHGISALAPAAALLLTAEKLSASRPTRDVYFAFTAEGQHSYKLYADAARRCGAAEAVCIGAIDESSSENVSVRICDRSFSSDKRLSDKLVASGATPVLLREGRCAASTVQLHGIPTCELDIPVKDAGAAKESVKECHINALAEILTDFIK